MTDALTKDSRVEVEGLSRSWLIRTPKLAGGRWGWEVPYPVNGYKIVSLRTYASKPSAGRAAWAFIKRFASAPNA